MTLPASGPERILWAILAILVAGYLLGSYLNRRRSQAIGRWLQAGLSKLGGRPGWKIMRSLGAGGRVSVADASAPFNLLEIHWGMLTRELPILWAIELLRGRRDTLAVRAEFRGEPCSEFEVLPLEGDLRRRLEKAAGDEPWQWQEASAGLGIATHGPLDRELSTALTRFIQRYGPEIQRLSLRRRRPHIMLFLRLDHVRRSPAAGLFESLRELGRAARASNGKS